MEEKKQEKLSLTKLEKNTFEVLATIDQGEVAKAQDSSLDSLGKDLEIKGFRKGKAPKKILLEHVNPQKLLEATLNSLVPGIYQEAIKQFGLKPIISPKIELVSAKDNENWLIKFTACEAPEVILENYKEEMKKEAKVAKIWKPGEKPSPKEEKSEEENKEESFNKAISWLLEHIKVNIGDPLLDDEVGYKLSLLLEQIQKLGLTVDQYLASTGKTLDLLKAEYRSQAEKSLALEFILQKIAEEEKIEVKPDELDKAISNAKSEEEKKAMEGQKYLLAGILRKQKTLDFLAGLL